MTPSLHLDYKRSRIKQYHKEGRALRTETTINELIVGRYRVIYRLASEEVVEVVTVCHGARLLRLDDRTKRRYPRVA